MTANCRVKFNPLVSKDGLPLSLDQVLKSVVNPKASLKNAPAVRQFYFDGTDVYLLAFLETGGPVFTVKSIRSVVSNHKILSDYAYKKISGDEVKRFRKTYPEMKFFEIERAVQNEFNVYRDTRVVNNLEIKDNYRSSDFSLDTQVPFFKTVVELDKSDKPFVFLDIPLPAILHAIRMRVKSDQAQAISAGEDSATSFNDANPLV